HDGGAEMLLKRLEDPNLRKKIIKDMVDGIPGWESIIKDSGPERVYISSVETRKNKDIIGKNLMEIGEMRNKDPYEAVFDLLIEEKNAVGMIIFSGAEENVITLMKRPEQNVCTDGLLGGKPHPRVYGSFPRVLGKYVRQEKVLSFEEAIKKMTSKPAEVFGIKNRGILKVGYYADMVVLNPNTIIDKATFENPIQYPEGIETVIINGDIILDQGIHTKTTPGKVLRKAIK
ncbi:MAG TPA: amidohydrolase family protein, partial [Thermoanaerobacterales bacterium]|nr:amidohydrolase family protein [Thermoanaerobacterales bacterium]